MVVGNQWEPNDDHVVDRLVDTVADAPAELRALGEAWYAGALWECEQLHTDFVREGRTIDQCIGVVAALSPRQTWSRNLVVAAEVLADREPSGVFQVQLAKAWRILRGVTPLDVLRGPKTSTFYRSIRGERTTDAVCVDGWMLGAIANSDGASLEQRHMNWLARKGQYERAQHIVAAVAESFDYDPVTAQAVVWVVARRSAN